jgi:alkanesulfonate monooxygenase SsuD/methylene tetrahydromethanopterin reductase-like flavin-dependent oxidoreductase (luciferase family)
MKFGLFYQLPCAPAQEAATRYQETIEQIVYAEELGFDTAWLAELHFNPLFSVMPAPLILAAVVAQRTTRIRLGTAVLLLPLQHPLRTAEEAAVVDLLSRGRLELGVGRGMIAIHFQGFNVPREESRVRFEEALTIIKQAWTQETCRFAGKYFHVPETAVVPKPLQKPHPPIFQPFASSENSIRWCAKNGVTAILPPMHEVHERNLFEVYASVSGRRPGEGMGMLRDIIIADSDEEAKELWVNSATFAGNAWFVPFGFRRGMLDPKTGEAPSTEEAIDKGYALVGTVDTVTRSLEALKKKLPVNWIFGWTHNTLVPHAKLMSSIERFYTEVLPRVS